MSPIPLKDRSIKIQIGGCPSLLLTNGKFDLGCRKSFAPRDKLDARLHGS